MELKSTCNKGNMKNRKTRIAIIIEVKKRELPFLSILQEILSEKGYSVKLIPFRVLCTWRLLFFRPHPRRSQPAV